MEFLQEIESVLSYLCLIFVKKTDFVKKMKGSLQKTKITSFDSIPWHETDT